MSEHRPIGRVRAAVPPALAAAILAASASDASAQTCPAPTGVVAIRGGTVMPVSSVPIEGGTVVLRNGRIEAVGRDVEIPAGATVIDATGRYVLPGLVDAMSYYGIAAQDQNEVTRPLNPELRALEAYNPFGDFGRERQDPLAALEPLSGGITTHYIAPADRTVIGGQGAVVKAAGCALADVTLRDPAAIDITLGEQPTKTFRDRRQIPSTRMAVISQLREALVRAQEYSRRRQAAQGSGGEQAPVPVELGNEALARLLNREIPARVQANRTVEIRQAMRLAQEFGFDLIIDSGAAAHLLAGELAAAGVPVVLGPISHPYVSGEEIPDVDEYVDADERAAARLSEAGVTVAIASFSRDFGIFGSGTGKWLLLDAAIAGGYGLEPDAVLRAVTLDAARILGVHDRIGSLEPGKDADVVIVDGPPLSVTSWVERVFVGGREVYRRGEG